MVASPNVWKGKKYEQSDDQTSCEKAVGVPNLFARENEQPTGFNIGIINNISGALTFGFTSI